MSDGVDTGTVTAVQLHIAGPVAPWERLGLTFGYLPDGNGRLDLDNCALVVRPSASVPALALALRIDDREIIDTIDGVALAACSDGSPVHGSGRLGAVSVDHLVVMTDSLERTSTEVERVTGQPLKRIRDAGGGVRQGFHRLGPGGVIVEIVERADVASPALWGFVLTVADLDAAIAGADGLIGESRDAVQPGRRIATARSAAGLGVPVALLSPPTL